MTELKRYRIGKADLPDGFVGISATHNPVPSGALLVQIFEMRGGREHQVWASTIYDVDYATRLVIAINAVSPTGASQMYRPLTTMKASEPVPHPGAGRSPIFPIVDQ